MFQSRFKKSKDLSGRSADDLACILGSDMKRCAFFFAFALILVRATPFVEFEVIECVPVLA
jgi:hypothetical protein